MATPFTDRTRITFAALASVAVFIIDTFTRLQSAVAVLYALVLIIADDGTARTRPLRWAWPCSALAVISFLVNHGAAASTDEMLRLLASLAAITVAALLVARNGRLREQVRASDARYETIFNSLALAIWEHDFTAVMAALEALRAAGISELGAHLRAHPEHLTHLRGLVRITDANDAARRLLGIPQGAAFFGRLSDFLPDDDQSFIDALIALDSRSPSFEAECRVRTAQGELIPILIAIRLPTDGSGHDRICASALDLSERRRMEAHLEIARLERDEALHRAIIASLSISIAHDVSQPLSSINAHLATARRWLSRTPPEVAEAGRAILQAENACADTAQVVAGVRELVVRGRMERSLLPFAELVGRVIDGIRARQPEIAWSLMPDDEGAMISGEASLLEQLVSGLVCSLLTGAGPEQGPPGMTLAVSADRSHVRLAISSGCGLPADRVRQVEDGLGLCRSIAQVHGGTIRITDPAETHRSIIELELPRACADRPDEAVDPPPTDPSQGGHTLATDT